MAIDAQNPPMRPIREINCRIFRALEIKEQAQHVKEECVVRSTSEEKLQEYSFDKWDAQIESDSESDSSNGSSDGDNRDSLGEPAAGSGYCLIRLVLLFLPFRLFLPVKHTRLEMSRFPKGRRNGLALPTLLLVQIAQPKSPSVCHLCCQEDSLKLTDW